MKRKKIFILLFSLILVSFYCNFNIYAYEINNIPTYKGNPSVALNCNIPTFGKGRSKNVYKKYSDLDRLNRVGVCEVLTGDEYIPTKKRGRIDKIYPTGWNQKTYLSIQGRHLYNRCHLIGYQIAGDNADERNLMTGTRYLNIDGMLPYENKITKYIKKTKHHVKYRVTPVFVKNESVARGVILEALSIEDNKIQFNVFCYNVQPGVYINYLNGDSILINPLAGLDKLIKGE